MTKALLVIDMLNDFLEAGGSLYIGDHAAEVTAHVARRIAAARRQHRQVIFVCDRHLPQDAEFQMFPPHCLAGSRGAEIVTALKQEDGDLIVAKRRFSAFSSTDLDLCLRERGITKIELSGVCTDLCVLYTAADARSLNYMVEVHRRAVASFDQQAHLFALQELEHTLGVTLY